MATLTYEEVAEACEALPSEEQGRLLESLWAKKAVREKDDFSEEKLIARVQSMRADIDYGRYNELAKKLEPKTLTESERLEFLEMNENVELVHAERMKLIGQLAALRHESLDETVSNLGLELKVLEMGNSAR